MFEREYREQIEKIGPSEGQLDAVLEHLSKSKAKPRHRAVHKLYRGAIVAAVAAALCVGGATAAVNLLTVSPGGFAGTSTAIPAQPYSAGVGMSVSDKGYTLTVDGIGVDEAFITLYATITGDQAIPDWESIDPSPAVWPLSLRAEGEELEFWSYDAETERIDDYTVKLVQRCPVVRKLPDVVALEIYANNGYLVSDISGDWQISLLVDKSAPDSESMVVEVNQEITLNGNQFKVGKVVVAPSGGGLTLTLPDDGPCPFFVLQDDQGNPLPIHTSGWVFGGLGEHPNFIEFYGGRTDMTSITFIPWTSDGMSHPVTGSLDALPLTDQADNGYTLLSVDVGPDRAVAVFQSNGVLGESDMYHPSLFLLDADGQDLELGDCYQTETRDAETGLWTVTISYPNAAPEQVAQAAGVWFWQPNFIQLLDETVTVSLID